MRASLLAVALILASASAARELAAKASPKTATPPAFKNDEVLVQFLPGFNPATEIPALMPGAKQKGNKIRASPIDGDLVLVQLPPGKTVAQAKGAFDKGRNPEGRGSVKFVEENWAYQPSALSNDPDLLNNALWGMTGTYGINAPAAWDAQTDCSSVVVGVIDTGIDVSHPDLAANIWRNPGEVADGVDNDANGFVDDVNGYDFYNNRGAVYTAADGDSHGTHVAGTIGGVANNGAGVAGVCWKVQIVAAKFLGPNGGYTSGAIQALDYLTSLKTRKGLNMVATSNSWGGGGYSQALADAITRSYNAGMLFIAAAGNSGVTTVSYPAGYNLPGVIAVAAIQSNGYLASYSNRGSWVHLAAPGSGIKSTTPGNTYSSYSGTSMACPHVSGAAALYKARYPAATAADVKTAILQTVTASALQGTGTTSTGGRLNAAAMLARVPGGGTPTCSCASNQYCVSGVCYACPSTCTACTSSTTCSACVAGYRGTSCSVRCLAAGTFVSKCSSCCSGKCVSKKVKQCA